MKTLVLDAPSGEGALRNVALTPSLNALLGLGASGEAATSAASDKNQSTSQYPREVFAPQQAAVAKVTLDVINELSRSRESGDATAARLTNSAVLNDQAMQQEIAVRVAARLTPAQSELLSADSPTVLAIVQRTASLVAEHTIDISRIQVKPRAGPSGHYSRFKLDISKLHLQPVDQQLVSMVCNRVKSCSMARLRLCPRCERRTTSSEI